MRTEVRGQSHLEADPVADSWRHPVAGDAEVGAAVPPGHAGQADHLPHHHRGVLAWGHNNDIMMF